jgi:hypothetical protein
VLLDDGEAFSRREGDDGLALRLQAEARSALLLGAHAIVGD